MKVYNYGIEVEIKQNLKLGFITGICLRPNNSVTYAVSFCNGTEVKESWFYEFELNFKGKKNIEVGFIK